MTSPRTNYSHFNINLSAAQLWNKVGLAFRPLTIQFVFSGLWAVPMGRQFLKIGKYILHLKHALGKNKRDVNFVCLTITYDETRKENNFSRAS